MIDVSLKRDILRQMLIIQAYQLKRSMSTTDINFDKKLMILIANNYKTFYQKLYQIYMED